MTGTVKPIDLRSDTVTHPSPAMREAMYRAELGDDVYDEDPTVNKLQELAAAKLGKEAALFVASGTMGNLVALLTHCGRGQQAIAGSESHIVLHEQGGAAALGGIFVRTVQNAPDGTLSLERVEAVTTTGDDLHEPRTNLLCLENTWNGRVLKPEYVKQARQVADKHRLKMHLDGARVFNAAIALGRPVKDVVSDFDSVQFCFSKGLAAPVGSILCGDSVFIKEAKRNRKIVGGAMRQVGVLAAACMVALEQMVERLAEDHENARLLADGINNCDGLSVDTASVETNIVIFQVDPTLGSADDVAAKFAESGVLVLAMDKTSIRAVTHYGIERPDIERALAGIKQSVDGLRRKKMAAV
jgi:threonine aldolase